MKYSIPLVAIFTLLITTSYKKDLTIKASSFSESHVPGNYILDAPEDWWHWCMAPIYDESGKLHVFMSAIPNNGSWIKDSKIVHYTAKTPAGPYTFVDTTFSSKTHTYHNPQISKVDDTYVLVMMMILQQGFMLKLMDGFQIKNN